jgi:UDP-N-acetylmuramyl pentapeptide synthase
LSITPGSILVAVEEVFEAGLNPDFFVFEISIGGTGNADFGILTTLSPDYGIANNTALASEAKVQLIKNAKPGSCILINAAAEKALLAAKEKPVKIFTFKDPFTLPSEKSVPANNNHADFEVEIKSRPEPESKLEPYSSDFSLPSDSVLTFTRNQKEIFSVPLLQGYDISAYKTAFLAASAAALEFNIKPEDIVAVLESFRGLSGRMQEKKIAGIAMIDNSNSGMDIVSAEKALEYALLKKKDEKKQGIILVLGEEASQVCEGLPPDAVQVFLNKFGEKFKHVILVGERMRRITAKNVSYAVSLPEGLFMATEAALETDIILSSVKCFR